HHSTVFGQFLRLVPRHEFDSLSRAHHSGSPLRSMSRFSQFVALATGHLAHRHSLRDVVANLQAQGPRLYHLGVQPVARSSFARVNETQPYTLYEALFGRLYDRCRHLAPRHGFRFKNKLYSMDSSLIDLSLRIFPWAHLALGKAAMKLHLGLDHDGFLPAFAVVTEGRTNDMIGAKQFAFSKGSIVVFDKGYSDYGWRQKLTDAGVYFVTRARGNMVSTVIEEGPPAKGQIDFDRRVQLTGKQKHSPKLKPLRLVGYTCPDTGRSYEFMTNIEHLSAQTIADIYKSRWQVELFFKWIKQNLKLKGFLGTSRNAVLTQIWVALCVCLLIAFLKFSSRVQLTMQQIARLLQLNLFLRRDLL
ncbi:IS4 family transposase, partial [Asticcacaulis sp. AC402]|uniref:IS4 family transposase n=1 Tax=Asticcacaulis sp. AC402 TaxID=1282361 RepID=UPI0004CF17AB